MKDIRENDKLLLAILAIIYLAARLPILDALPFIKDEGLYAAMIEEQISHPTLVTTFLGYSVAWKPPIFFWVSGLFVSFLRSFGFLSIEAVYRLPCVLFGLINVYLVFLIIEKLTQEKDVAFLSALLYSTFFIAIHVDIRVLTDALCGTALLSAIYFYLNGLSDRKFFLLGGLFTFVTYFVKQTNAAAAPVIAVAFLFEKDRKKILDPIFLVSLLAYPLASWLFNAMSYNAPTGALEQYFFQTTILDKLSLVNLWGSSVPLYLSMSVWLSVSLFGLWKNWRKSITMSVWFLLIVFPLIGGSWMPWYFYPVLLPIAYFSVEFLIRDEHGKKVKDNFFYFVFILLILAAFGLGLMNHLSYREAYIHEKDAGEFLAGKENVLIIGTYEPSIPSYKMLEEKRLEGKWLDFGWIILNNASSQNYIPFIQNYYSNHTKVVDGNFMSLFAASAIYRKDTNITTFDYVCIVGNETVNPGGMLVFNESNTTIYKMR